MVVGGCSWLASCCWVVVGGCSWLAVVVDCAIDRFVVFFWEWDVLFYCNVYIILLC